MSTEFSHAELVKATPQVLAWHSFVMHGKATREDFERTFGEATPNTLAITKRMVRFTLVAK